MKVLVTEGYLANIADAIREKLGGNDTYRPGDMAEAIESIETGYPEPTGTLPITANGTVNVKDYASANVNVPNSYAAEDEGKVVSSGALVAQTSRSVTENGTYDTTENNEVVVNVSGGSGGKEIDIYAFNFSPTSNANTARSGGLQISPLYDLRIVGVRFWARDNACSVYISDTSGNVIAEKQGAAVTANQWNDVLFDTPVALEKNTSYVVWGSNQTSTMRYVSTSLSSLFVTYEAAKYSTSQDTFPATTESGNAKYGVDLIIAFGTGVAKLGTLNVTQNGTYDASDEDLDGYSQVVVNVQGGGVSDEILYNHDFTLNTTGQTTWDATNSGTSANSRVNIIDGWNIMQCTAEIVSGGLKIVPQKAYAYLTCQIPPYWFNGKRITLKVTVNGVEYSQTGTFSAIGSSININTPFGVLYCYGYSGADSVFSLSFVNQINQEFIVSTASAKLATT